MYSNIFYPAFLTYICLMSHTFLLYHIVIATKERRMAIRPDCERSVYKILFHILNKQGCYVYRINGMPDHIHLLIDASPNIAPAKLVGELKRQSSLFIRSNTILPDWSGWSEGYYLETLSRDALENVRQYIINQKSHHIGQPFLDEYRNMLIAQGINPDNTGD